MALNPEEFDTLVSRLESFTRKQPAIYKLLVFLLAALGYAYIFGTLAGLFTVLIAITVIMWQIEAFYSVAFLLWYLVILGVMVVPILVVWRSLWVFFPPPQGLTLQRQDVPDLFALVDQLTAKLKVPRFHHILLTEDFNAGVIQRPRWGLLGWQQNYLLLGLPLMQGLSPQEFTAVVAHELGHLSGNHSLVNGWIYRVQKIYSQLFAQLDIIGNQIVLVIFARFFQWYAPFFSAYSFVLRRTNEYEADRCAAEITGVQIITQALINVQLKDNFLRNSFWPSIHKQVENRLEPPNNTFTRMSTALLTGVDPQDASHFLEQALAKITTNEDTHPCLTDRLKALGYPTSINELPLPAQAQVSAASELLGNAFGKFTDYLNQTWQAQVEISWRQQYAYAQESLTKLRDLEKKQQNQCLTTAEAWNFACLTLDFKSKEAAISLLQAILIKEANHVPANYLLGEIFLQQHNFAGIDYIEKAITQDSDKLIEGCELIYSFLKKQGKISAANSYQERIRRYRDELLKAHQERSDVKGSDKFKPHNIPDSIVQSVCRKLALHNDVKTAYLAEKVVQYFPDRPFYVLGVKRRWKFVESQYASSFLLQALHENIELPGNYYIMILDNWTKDIEKKLRQIPQSAIYQKS